MGQPRLYPLNGPEERLLHVILDQIRNMHTTPLKLPVPEDSRLRKIYKHLSTYPGDRRTLEDRGKAVGATRRTLTRLFRLETGMSFGKWRQQLRILEALRRLGKKEPVTTVSIDFGYDSLSAFISMFKKALGKTQLFRHNRFAWILIPQYNTEMKIQVQSFKGLDHFFTFERIFSNTPSCFISRIALENSSASALPRSVGWNAI